MNEIGRAIKVLEEEYAFTLECDATQKRSSAYKTALAVLRAELSRQENVPLTWNERINQMTVRQKAANIEDFVSTIHERADQYAFKRSKTHKNPRQEFVRIYNEYMRKFLHSPYTEGASK